AISDPARASQVAVERHQATELAVAGRIEPEIADGAAAIPLPAGRIGGVAPEHDAAVGPARERAGRSVRQAARQTAVEGDLPQPQLAPKRMLGRAGVDDRSTILAPANHADTLSGL